MFKGSNHLNYINVNDTLPLYNQSDLFLKYTGIFPSLGERYRSIFRKDTMPGCRFVWYSGILYFVDNAAYNGKVFFNIADVVSILYHISIKEAIHKIVSGNSIGGLSFEKHQQLLKPKSKPQIRIKYKPWQANNYFGIDPAYLDQENVRLVTDYWIKTDDEWKYNPIHNPFTTLTIAYIFDDRVKLYFPHQKQFKWYSSCTETDVYGEHKIDSYLERDSSLIIYTKSQKDRLLLDYVYGYNALATQGETMDIPADVVLRMKEFDRQLILYDYDAAGQTYASKLSERYDIPWLNIEIAKDVFDATSLFGVNNVKQYLKTKLCQIK